MRPSKQTLLVTPPVHHRASQVLIQQVANIPGKERCGMDVNVAFDQTVDCSTTSKRACSLFLLG